MILDAKFKEKWSEIVLNKGAIYSVLEDYDKCVRDMVSINSHATGVVFPTNNVRAMQPTEYIKHSISEYNSLDKFYTFPIFVPYSSDNYRAWLKDFRTNCQEISKMIKDCVAKEKNFMLTSRTLVAQLEALR